MATTHHCLEIFAAPHESLSLPEADRRKIFNGITKSSGPGGFKPGELTHKAELSWFEEFSVMAVLLFVVGGPLLILLDVTQPLLLKLGLCGDIGRVGVRRAGEAISSYT